MWPEFAKGAHRATLHGNLFLMGRAVHSSSTSYFYDHVGVLTPRHSLVSCPLRRFHLLAANRRSRASGKAQFPPASFGREESRGECCRADQAGQQGKGKLDHTRPGGDGHKSANDSAYSELHGTHHA